MLVTIIMSLAYKRWPGMYQELGNICVYINFYEYTELNIYFPKFLRWRKWGWQNSVLLRVLQGERQTCLKPMKEFLDGSNPKEIVESHYGRSRSWRGNEENTGQEGRPGLSGNIWREDSCVLSLMSPLSLFKRNSTLLPGTEVIVWGRLGSPLVNILFRTKLLSLVPLSWDTDFVLTLWLTLPLVPLVTFTVRLVFWFLSFLKEVSCTATYIYSQKNH